MPAKNTIKLRTGTGTPTPASFAPSEPIWDSANALLYVKSGAGAMVPIGVIPYATTANFPATGVSPTLYLATDTGRIYRWTGTVYAEMGAPNSGGAGLPNRNVTDIGTVSTNVGVSIPADSYDGVVTVTLAASVTITLGTPASTAGFLLVVKQDATGGRVATFAGSIAWSDGVQPLGVINANTFIVYRFLWTGTTYLGWIEGQPQGTFGVYTVR